MGWADRRVLVSGGVWTTSDLRATLGWRDISDAVGSGVISHPWRGSYCDPRADLCQRLIALQHSVGRTLVVCHTTAAQLHGFGVLHDDNLHVTTADGRSLRQRPGVVLHQSVPRQALVERHGLLLTDPAETAIGVARAAIELDILPILDAALSSGIDHAELSLALEHARRARGIRAVRHWLDHADGLAESPMESRSRFRVLEAGLPAPELQITIDVNAGQRRRLDLGWRQRRVGLEYDGEDFHSGNGSLQRDRRRHNDLTGAGWTMVYATASDIYRDPARLIAHLRHLLS